MRGLVAGVDLGGTHIASGVVDEKGRVRGFVEGPAGTAEGSRGVLRRVAESVRASVRSAGVPLSRLKAVGVGSPGPLDPKPLPFDPAL